MAVEQAAAIDEVNADPKVGAIVMTGAGRGFCAGADMEATFKSRIDGVDPGEDTASGSGGMPASLDWVGLLRRSKPLVAAVNGAAVGIGMTMILPFDVIVASGEGEVRCLHQGGSRARTRTRPADHPAERDVSRGASRGREHAWGSSGRGARRPAAAGDRPANEMAANPDP
jgi:hypothetical protein